MLFSGDALVTVDTAICRIGPRVLCGTFAADGDQAGPIVAHELTRPLAALLEYTPSRAQFVIQVADSWLWAMAPLSR